MTRERLFEIAYNCGYKPGQSPASVILEIRKQLTEYFNSPEGRECLKNAPRQGDYSNINGDGSVSMVDIVIEKRIDELIDMIKNDPRRGGEYGE